MSAADDETKDYYLKIFEDFPAMIWRSGLDMKCDYFNRTWLAFTGRTMDQELGDGWAEGVHPDDLDGCLKTYVDSFNARIPFAMYYRLRNKFGEYRWIKDLGRPFYNLRDVFMGYIGSCYDVTEERENERKMEELNHSKDKFFSIVAHDLMGPITAIESMTEMLAQNRQDFHEDELDTAMRELHLAARKVCTFLNDILTWSYSQLQGMTRVPESRSVFPLAEEAVEPLRENMKLKRVSFTNSIDRDLSVYADPNMVKTIIRNLVSNAVKFSEENGRVELSGTEKDGYALIRVADEGIGIPSETLAGMFSLGNRDTRTGTAGEKGSGFGLVLCKEFAEKNQGKIWAESREGKGSVFTVMLPKSPHV